MPWSRVSNLISILLLLFFTTPITSAPAAADLVLEGSLEGGLRYSITATRKGVPIPASEIKLKPLETYQLGNPPSKATRLNPRANPIANSSNWCGSVNTAPSGKSIVSVTGMFQHPNCAKRTGSGVTWPQAVAAWVGIDGDSWTSALLQAGSVCEFATSSSAASHGIWWQWVPLGAYAITSLSISPGQWLEVTINATSTTSAQISLMNLHTGVNYNVILTNGPTLARVNANWVVERPYYGSTLVTMPAFSDVWFTYASASLTPSGSLGILGAKQYQIPGFCGSEEYDNTAQVSYVP